jgi:hypothetical protein
MAYDVIDLNEYSVDEVDEVIDRVIWTRLMYGKVALRLPKDAAPEVIEMWKKLSKDGVEIVGD